MNQKNTLGLDICFQDLNNPVELFRNWIEDAKKSEPNDPNALALATADKKGIPSVRMVLLKDFSEKGFVFYTNFNSPKSLNLKENPNASMCIHWKSLQRQIRIAGSISKVTDEKSDKYEKYLKLSEFKITNRLFTTYDNYIKEKYKIDINYKTLNTVKNYFN